MLNRERKRTVKKKGWGLKKMNWTGPCVAAACMVVLFLGSCGNNQESEKNTESPSGAEAIRENTETAQEDIAEEVCKRIKNMDFMIEESPIDTSRYDTRTDNIYKEAFLKAITNQIPIQYQDKEDSVYYKDLLQNNGELDRNGAFKYIRQSDYYYQDFDGDGLPELTITTEGPCVLKYDPVEEKVILYYWKEQGWNLLGTGKMYFYRSVWKPGNIRDTQYAYETMTNGSSFQEVRFNTIFDFDAAARQSTYRVSADGYEDIVLEEEVWYEITDPYMKSAAQAPHPMSFASLFGEEGKGGYSPGSEPWPRHLPENREALPMNEENGEEWAAYKAMLEGDFSLVDEEHWGSLQYRYELNLEEGSGRCNWSYFLMDFNQDGSKELCIRFNRREYNDTAFFRYENGRIKMWGSYDSADSHGYDFPLINGRIVGVSWYQDDESMGIYRLDLNCESIMERGYDSTRMVEDQDYSWLDASRITEEGQYYEFQDCYQDGEYCGSAIQLSEDEWEQINHIIDGLRIPEDAWQSCTVFTPSGDRPQVPSYG